MVETGKVSVIVNCRNGEKYLLSALESILSQSYENLEVIFWDNQSTDHSAKIFKSISDVRFRYFYAPTFTNLYSARNLAIEKSVGELIAFLDVDDWWEPFKLARQVKLFESADVGLVYSNYYRYEESSKITKTVFKAPLPSGNLTNQLIQNYQVGLLTIVVRKRAFEYVSGFTGKYNIIGDFDFVIRISSNYKIGVVSEPLAFYRWHDENLSKTNTGQTVAEFEDWKITIEKDNPAIYIENSTSIARLISYHRAVDETLSGTKIKAIMSAFRTFSAQKIIIILVFNLVPVTKLKKLLGRVKSIIQGS